MEKKFILKEFILKQLDNKLQIEGNEVIYLDLDKISDYLKGMFSVDSWGYIHSWCKSRIGGCYVINYSDGTKIWYKNGLRHRDNDKPAVMPPNGDKWWYKNGELHRDNDLPAIIDSDGTKEWFKNGKLHRDNDKPTIIDANGTKSWHKNGSFIK